MWLCSERRLTCVPAVDHVVVQLHHPERRVRDDAPQLAAVEGGKAAALRLVLAGVQRVHGLLRAQQPRGHGARRGLRRLLRPRLGGGRRRRAAALLLPWRARPLGGVARCCCWCL
jgi:hypothetical protein